MLTKIHIQNFRLCKDVRIDDAGRVVALVGRNGAGKSNVFQAIAQTARLATMGDAPGGAEFRPGQQAEYVSLEFDADNSATYQYERSVHFRRATAPVITERLALLDNTQWVTVLERNAAMVTLPGQAHQLAIGDLTPSLAAVATLLPATDPVVQQIAPARSFLAAVRYYPLDEPVAQGDEDRIISRLDYTTWLTEYISTGNGPCRSPTWIQIAPVIGVPRNHLVEGRVV